MASSSLSFGFSDYCSASAYPKEPFSEPLPDLSEGWDTTAYLHSSRPFWKGQGSSLATTIPTSSSSEPIASRVQNFASDFNFPRLPPLAQSAPPSVNVLPPLSSVFSEPSTLSSFQQPLPPIDSDDIFNIPPPSGIPSNPPVYEIIDDEEEELVVENREVPPFASLLHSDPILIDDLPIPMVDVEDGPTESESMEELAVEPKFALMDKRYPFRKLYLWNIAVEKINNRSTKKEAIYRAFMSMIYWCQMDIYKKNYEGARNKYLEICEYVGLKDKIPKESLSIFKKEYTILKSSIKKNKIFLEETLVT